MHHEGRTYLVIVDRHSNWPIVSIARDGATGLTDILRGTFSTFGIPEELSTDGGPEFTAHVTQKFLQAWGIHHRLSSVAFPHSNCRAEIGVKTIKRLIAGNTKANGSLDCGPFQRAILQYRNTTDPQTGTSPAQYIFGRPIRDLLPIIPGRYAIPPQWRKTLTHREEVLAKKHATQGERWTRDTRPISPLRQGDRVWLQNQIGIHPTKWDRVGTVIEVRQHHQYLIKIDGSGRTTLRNRKFLRRMDCNAAPSSGSNQIPLSSWATPAPDPTIDTGSTPLTTSDPAQPINPSPSPRATTPPGCITPSATNRNSLPPSATPPPTSRPLRRSTRTRREPTWLRDDETWEKTL